MASTTDDTGEESKRGRGRPPKEQMQLQEREVDEIDRIKPSDMGITAEMIEELEEWTAAQIEAQLDDQEEWHQRRQKYMPEFENLLRDNRIDGPWENSADFHVPLTMWMMKQMHARIYAALIGDGYGFSTVPQEKMDIEQVRDVDQTMRWAITSYANEWEGISLDIDDWIWDTCKEGWGVLKVAWDKTYQKIALTQSELERFNRNASIETVLQGMMQLVKTWDGPRVTTVEHENMLFPGRARNSSDMNKFAFIAELIPFTKEAIEARVADGLWMRKPSNMVLKYNDKKNVTGNRQVDDTARLKDAAQGVKSVDSRAPLSSFPMYECNARVDIDHDSFEEDLVYMYDHRTRRITRIQTLDRLSTSMKRCYHKVDFIRRPRRTRGIGMAELLYSTNREIDAMHNQRIDFGTLASIPTFFFRPLSGLKSEKIRLSPGQGIPIANPRNDIFIPQFNTNVQFTRNEESMLINYAERMAALPAITGGQSPTPAGPASTATGMTTLIAQTGFDFDVILNRFKVPFERMLKNMHSLMMTRMPEGYRFRVLGSGNQEILDADGNPIIKEGITRQRLYGDFDFRIRANDRSLNREVEKQDALVMINVLFNPVLLQSGLVSPQNIYNIIRNYLSKRGEIDIDSYITSPQQVEQPLSAVNEIVVLTQGHMPRLVMNDDHDAKIKALTMYMESPQFVQDVRGGVFSIDVPDLFKKTIAKHEQMQSTIQAQANQANVTGQQVGTSLGARMSGQLNQQSGRSIADQQIADIQEPQTPRTQGGLEIPAFGLRQ